MQRSLKVATRLSAVFVSAAVTAAVSAVPAQASTSYDCPLSSGTICDNNPLSGSVGGTSVNVTGGVYGFDLKADDTPGYIQVDKSSQIDMSGFPISVSVEVKGVQPPSATVGDYDVVRGTVSGFWKIEIMARSNRTTALAFCHFKGASRAVNVIGGPDLSKLQGVWTKITCTNFGTAVELRVGDSFVKTTKLSTGLVKNPGGMLIGAKDTNGADQFSGYARNVQVTGL